MNLTRPTPEDLAGVRILDVRRSAAFAKADSIIPGAQWRDPEQLALWSSELKKGEPVIVYCVYGHEVGRSTAMRLRAAGIDARFLRGGIDGWTSAGRPLAREVSMPAPSVALLYPGDRAMRDRADPAESRFAALFQAFERAGVHGRAGRLPR